MDMDLENFLVVLQASLGKRYNKEQLEFISNLTVPTKVEANPGTGKTTSSVAGLLTAELYHKIPGENIYAISFTNLATSELANTHADACSKLPIRQRVNFTTLHKLCTKILMENYRLLDMDDCSIKQLMSHEELCSLLGRIGEEKGWNITEKDINKTVRAVSTLNSMLIFDERHVVETAAFKKCRVSYETFLTIRQKMYRLDKSLDTVPVGDITIVCYELLMRNPKLCEEWKKKCRVLLVDEAQDLSVLQLGILHLLTDNLIFMGDPKQQIFAFNGACQEILDEYDRFYPDARVIKLVQSYRCKSRIAEYATKGILYNKVGGEDFRGVTDGGEVLEVETFNATQFAQVIREEYDVVSKQFEKDTLVLFRNNYSSIPLVEELYKLNVPFRCDKYYGAHKMPIVKDLCLILQFCEKPEEFEYSRALNMLIPEFQEYKIGNPLCNIAKKQKQSPFEVNYDFHDDMFCSRVMEVLISVQERLKQGATCKELFNMLWPFYDAAYMAKKKQYMDKEPEYYIQLVAPLLREKTFSKFMQDEADKLEKLKEYNRRRVGIRCYTMHAAKGLEADNVYIIDADEGVLPSAKNINDLIKMDCLQDAARDIRNERSLVYVACTRAKSKLVVCYSPNSGLSGLFTEFNQYAELDDAYDAVKHSYDDLESFKEFYSA